MRDLEHLQDQEENRMYEVKVIYHDSEVCSLSTKTCGQLERGALWGLGTDKWGAAADIEKQPAGLQKKPIGQGGSSLESVTNAHCVTFAKALPLSEPVFTSVKWY